MTLTKTTKVVGLFVAAMLTVNGCSSQGDYDDDCYDADNDGYCDDGGGSRGSSSTYIHSQGSKRGGSVSTGESGIISSGAKGGIGSSGSSSAG